MMRNISAILLVALILGYAAIDCCLGLGVVRADIGARFDFRSGVVLSVDPRSPAALAGIRAGDSADFSRGGWLLHVSLNRVGLYTGQHRSLPLVRDGAPFIVTVVGPPAAPPPDAWARFLGAALTLFYAGIGLALYVLRRSATSFAFFLFAVGAAGANNNLAWLRIASPRQMPLAMLVSGICPVLLSYGLLYFALIFANQTARTALARRFLYPYIFLIAALYQYHFYAYTIWFAPFDTYAAVSALAWLTVAIAAFSITTRINRDPSMAAKLRWIAVAVWAQAIMFAVFFIVENLAVPSSQRALISYVNFWFQPGILSIAYVLLRTRVIDVRVVGARTLVYAMLTAIPIGLFSAVDWFFARRLADARLATFVEFAVAVLFGIWLNSLHKRIDRFVERVVFASRHHAFQRVRHAVNALASAENIETPIAMLCDEGADALRVASAAVFIERAGTYERAAARGWNDCAAELLPDDSLVLFARSHGRAIRLSDVAPSASLVPDGDAKPELAIPIHVQHRTVGVALYGRHSSGEHIDADEEELLTELAHAAGAALQRLQSIERVRELEAELRIASI